MRNGWANVETSSALSGALTDQQDRMFGVLSGSSVEAVKEFCALLPDLPKEQYADTLVGMGYLYEAFDLMFAVISASIQATQDESDYTARYQTMQNVLQPFSSEFGIEPDRPLASPHRKLYSDFYTMATGEPWPSIYPNDPANPWMTCGRRWTAVMLGRLRDEPMSPMERARYNLGYHWAVEALSVSEFDHLVVAWSALGFDAPYMNAHCEVEEEHAACAIGAITTFTSVDDELVVRGAIDHEADLADFYRECSGLVRAAWAA
jgi:hypothetical protein